ncbi:family 2B encapsulin nanocompartment shell protein [Micromonospora olivasterospora]|uniref:Cyclic nucleotide-binding domain-containing protein n=1 Tax=Micromonospora olivasterospora TaxID=1880 RepID=F5HSX3_MICOL|nr:family 2B encapsulin nanocompartment shell protein [Micromonospora olivasterospora]TWH66841.1 Cyclic nucleotide-binding domain-containing protein [Micromonospora olivasterospora]BAK26792.1 nucleotide-binding protein [Micromonospora olivasterospora]
MLSSLTSDTVGDGHTQISLSTAAARNLATTTKSVPQMQEISSRWLLRNLPWVQVSAGTYRVNRRLSYRIGDGRVSFVSTGADIQVVPPELCELALLRNFGDESVLRGLAGRFTRRDFEPGQVIARSGTAADHLYLIVHGKVAKHGTGAYGDPVQIGVLADGEFFGDQTLLDPDATWEHSVRALTSVTTLALPKQAFTQLLADSPSLREHVERFRLAASLPQNRHGEAAIEIAAGHTGEPTLAGTFVDYELAPREYELAVAQTVLRVHTRVADLYNEPMNQLEQQLRLTVEALRERQEHELVNNTDFGLLHNADHRQRIHTRTGPPTPDDLDELLTMRRGTRLFLAHPKAIAAFGRECTRRGIYPDPVEVDGHRVPAWRGVPIFPCGKIPISGAHTTSILAMRTGEDDQGVVGLHQTGIPDEYQPSLSVRFMGINDQAIMSYLVSAYFSVAVLVPDALGVLEDVQLSHYGDQAA